jgi:N-acetylmuramoyl-L-alanine amidase
MQIAAKLLASARMRSLQLIGSLSFALTTYAHATDWNVLKHQGRDYVRFQNVAEFYRFDDYSHANRTISLRSERRVIRAQVGTSEIQINGVRFFTCFPLVERAEGYLLSAMDVGKIIEPVLRPSRIGGENQVETVVLDPGHGGMDQGAANSWGTEKDFALDVALATRGELQRAGFKVEMTRSDDQGVSLEDRVEFANRFPHAVFVSIHFNSSSGGAGVESFRLVPEGVPTTVNESEQHQTANDAQPDDGNTQDNQNIALAAAVHASVLTRVQAFDRGVRHARFKVLRHIRIPAMLLEAGFLNNPSEGMRIATTQYRQQLAAAIAQGVQSYNTAVNYRTPEANFAAVRTTLPPHTRSITEPLHFDAPAPPQPPHEPSLSIDGGE